MVGPSWALHVTVRLGWLRIEIGDRSVAIAFFLLKYVYDNAAIYPTKSRVLNDAIQYLEPLPPYNRHLIA